jgi:hypothetical protein
MIVSPSFIVIVVNESHGKKKKKTPREVCETGVLSFWLLHERMERSQTTTLGPTGALPFRAMTDRARQNSPHSCDTRLESTGKRQNDAGQNFFL